MFHVELDDGGGADRILTVYHTPRVGQTFDAHGRTWRVVRVEADRGYALAKIVD